MNTSSLVKAKLPHGAVGKVLSTKIPTVSPDATVEEVRDQIPTFARETDSIDYLYVVNDHHQLVGVLSIKELTRFEPDREIKQVMIRQLVVSHPHVKKSRVAHLAIKHNIKAVPIVDEKNKLLGVLSSDALLSILHEEHRLMMNRHAGIVSLNDTYGTILDYGIWRSFISRLPWILIGLIGGTFAAHIIQQFEEVLSYNLLIASFMPLVVYISSAVGYQTQTFFIRDISFNAKLEISKYTAKQLMTTLLLGFVCAVIVFVFITAVWHSPLAGAISIAIFASISSSTVISVFIPYILYRLNQDPASGSGPFATILQDLLSIYLYFLIVSHYLL